MADGASRLCSALEAAGVRCAFGLPGTPAVPLFEALRRSRIRFVTATHETAAGFMANGYARVGRRVGVLVTSAGPGFAWAVPALAEARLDSAPLLHVSVTPSGLPGRRFRHQEIPERSMVEDLVKGVVEVDRGDPAAAGRRAHALALDGEPGPVVLRLGAQALETREVPEAEDGPGRRVRPGRYAGAGDPHVWRPGGAVGTSDPATSPEDVPPELLRRAARSRRPVLFAGAGAVGAGEDLRRLAESWPAPVFTTPSGRGIVPEDHPLALGFDPVAGGLEPLNELLDGADLVLALGCKTSHAGTAGFRLRLAPDVLVHVNTDPDALGANYPAALGLRTRAEAVVSALLAPADAVAGASRASEWTPDEVGRWRERIRSAAAPGPPEPAVRGASGFAGFFTELRETLPPEAVLVTDSGLHQVLARRHFEVRGPVGLLLPTDFASMGFGIPAAVGAALAVSDRPVAALVGDGGLANSAMELGTAAREGLGLPVVVFDDGHLNLIRLQQIRGVGRTHAVDVEGPDLETLARSLGAAYARWADDGPDAVRGALRRDRPTLIHVELGDSSAIRAERLHGAARSVARSVLGPEQRAHLRRILGREG